MLTKVLARAGALFAALGACAAAHSAELAPEPAPVVTRHTIEIGGKRLAYEAEAGRLPILDAGTGRVLAQMFYVAYRVPSKTPRPLMFMWNGGPGLPAASVHFEGFGPRRVEQGRLVDNADTILTDSDLVFVDPIGTGYSRAADDETLQAFITTVGDIDAAIEFVRAFLIRHGREHSPLIISGQSFGAGRAGSAAHGLLKRGFDVRAIALVSNTKGLPSYAEQALIAPAIHIADYGVAALWFGKLPAELGTTPAAARANAEAWARDTYLPMLRRRDSLSPSERDALAVELARRTGLAAADINRTTLTIGQGFFLGHIAPGRMPYYSDYRFFEPYIMPSQIPGIRSIRNELGYVTTLPYLPEEPPETGFLPFGKVPRTINQRWRPTTVADATDAQIDAARAEYAKRDLIGAATFGPPLPGAAEAIALAPRLRVIVQHGAYDPLGGCSIDAEHVRRLEGAAREAVTARCYTSGHAIYRDAPARAAYADDIRSLAWQILETGR